MRFIFAAAVVGLLLDWGWAASVRITKKDSSIEKLEVKDTLFFDVPYISKAFFEAVFQAPGKAIPIRQKYLLTDFFEKQWYITVDNPYLVREGEVFNLVYPARRSSNDLYLPIVPSLNILNEVYSLKAEYDPKNKIISLSRDSLTRPLSDAQANILNLRKTDMNNGVLVEVALSRPMKFQSLSVFPNYILTLPKGKLAAPLLESQRWDGLLKSFSSVQEDSSAQLTFQIGEAVDTVETAYREEDTTVAVLIRRRAKTGKSVTQPNPKKIAAESKTVILDPGHGGTDPGAVYKNAKEKEVTLAISKKLKQLLKAKGLKVLLTREKDQFVPLRDRPKFASDNSGDLFVSLHCNSISGTPKKLKDISGFVAYILRAGESEEDKALARRENEAIEEAKKENNKATISPVDWILLEHELNLYSHQSEKFAEEIVNSFENAVIGKHRTGAHQAGFFVLVGAFMPAVLFEIGFITNDKDRAYMLEPKGQDDIAKRLASAIIKFLKIEE